MVITTITLDARSSDPIVRLLVRAARQQQRIQYRVINADGPTRAEVWEDVKWRIRDVEHIALNPWTMVTVETWYTGRRYVGIGFARCSKTDVWDEQEGYRWAYRRAEKHLLKTIMAAVKGDARG